MFKKLSMTVALVLASLISASAFSQGVPAVTQTQFMTPPDNVRDFRYCEIIPVFRERLTFKIDVYNTIDFNDCPTEEWNALDKEVLKEEYGAVDVILNGPRFWVLNEIIGEEATATGQVSDFSGIEMRLVAQIETKLWQGTVGSELYAENEVERTTTYTYSAGNMVYELSSPEGDVYRMQSYSQIVDPSLTIDDLETLGSRLNMPEGWTYEARVLTEDSQLKADGLALVINDDFGSSYQKIFTETPEAATANKEVPAITQTQFMIPPADIRNFRYCEIIPVFRERLKFNVEVYNTIDLNDCPAELWDVLDAEAMAESYGAVQVKLNGPRFWVINEVIGEGETATGKTVDFGGIEMILRATIQTMIWEGTVGSELYVENEVERSTTYTYLAGNMVYELTAPNGDVYRMQSYSQIVDPDLTIDDLETLDDRLNLPEGWSYNARVLTEDSYLTADGLALVINDNLGSSYQKIPLSETEGATSTITPSSNDTGIYTTATAFEHGDAGRTHLFDSAVFDGDLNGSSSNNIGIRKALGDYPGAYNIVTRNPDELYVYFGVYGEVEGATGPTVALLNADTLAEEWRTAIDAQGPQEWIYPGALGLHGNGNLYVVGGNTLASLDPETGEILVTTKLPTENALHSAYNGYNVASDGTIFVKPVYRACDAVGGSALLECPDPQTPSVLSAVNPDTLEIISQVAVAEPVFSRIIVGTHSGQDYVYMQGARSLFRYNWNGVALTLDEDWGSVAVLKEGQIGTASPSISEDWLFFNTNGLPDSSSPMTVWAISTQNSDMRFSIEPFADITNGQSFNVSMGSFDPENNRFYVADTGVGHASAISFDPDTGFELLWREPQTTYAYTMLVNSADQRVFVASDLTGFGSNVSPFLARNERIVFRDAATGLELARTSNLPRMNSGANFVAGFLGRFYFLGQDSKIYELTVD